MRWWAQSDYETQETPRNTTTGDTPRTIEQQHWYIKRFWYIMRNTGVINGLTDVKAPILLSIWNTFVVTAKRVAKHGNSLCASIATHRQREGGSQEIQISQSGMWFVLFFTSNPPVPRDDLNRTDQSIDDLRTQLTIWVYQWTNFIILFYLIIWSSFVIFLFCKSNLWGMQYCCPLQCMFFLSVCVLCLG